MRRMLLVVVLVAASLGLMDPTAQADEKEPLELYTARVDAQQAKRLAREGVEIVTVRPGADRSEVDVVLTPQQRDRLAARGVEVTPKRNRAGKTQRQLFAEQQAGGYTVWRSWDEPGGIRDELYQIARDNPQLVRLRVLARTYQGREIIALKVTQGARGVRDGARPAVLYSSLQHAREWISVEVNRRTLHYFIDGWKANDREIRRLLRSTELWFVIVANPDGYEYTFDIDRLWRKNLRDNDGDGQITNNDGVDPNRNFDEHWGYDNEGSSPYPSSETYRGPSPASEPETRAMQGLLDQIKPKFQSNWHSYGQWILYPQGWQTGTPEADNPIYVALAGTDANPAIPGFDPGISSDELYVTNGETTDYADSKNGTIAFTPELGEGEPGAGFVFPDNEALVQAEFEKTLPFSLSLARSATRPANPVSSVGISTEPFYLDQADIDPENRPLSMFDFRFDVSYGDPQEVRVLAKRSLGPVMLRYRINGGSIVTKRTSEWTHGERYGVGNPKYYRVVRSLVTGTDPGDKVEVWFTGGGRRSESFTYEAVSDSNDRVLVVAAEDYTGASPTQPPGPHYLSYYDDALRANGIRHDVYDVDANDRTAPDALGVLSHYDAVIWYTGDDIITREPGWGPGNASSLAQTELLEVRDYLNEGGRALYTGKYAGHQYALGHGFQYYNPFENMPCIVAPDPDPDPRCRPLTGSGDLINDVIEYWFGAGTVNEDAGTVPGSDPVDLYDVIGVDRPFTGQRWGFNGPDSADNQDHSASFLTTSGLLPPSQFPQFRSWVAAEYDRPGGPYQPHTGEYYVYSQIADVSYKRLTRTFTVPAGGHLTFWTSYDTEPAWDHLFVEIRNVGQDNWTTLPDQNGHTTQATGESCPAGWRELHPHLDHYQTVNPDGTCSPTGTTGQWHAASGNSGGWQQWDINLTAYAGQQVEVSIAYASDWAVQGLGVFIDDIQLTGEPVESFETDLGAWTVTGPPEGSAPNPNNFIRSTAAGFPEGAVVATPDTLYMGFGFEGISGEQARNEVMRRAMRYLLR